MLGATGGADRKPVVGTGTGWTTIECNTVDRHQTFLTKHYGTFKMTNMEARHQLVELLFPGQWPQGASRFLINIAFGRAALAADPGKRFLVGHSLGQHCRTTGVGEEFRRHRQ